MDFELSEDHKLIKDTVARFVRDEYGFEDRQKITSSDQMWSDEVYGQLAELGLIAAVLPEAAGGIGGSGLDIMVIMEELGRGLVIEPFFATAILGAGALAAVGGHEELLEGVIAGETRLAFAHHEPGRRYSVNRVDATATVSGDTVTLNGAKSVVAQGGAAHHIIVSAKDGDEMVLVLVPADSEGMTVRAYQTNDGGNAAEITLENVELGAGAVIARGDAAASAIHQTLNRGLLALGAESIGAMEAARDLTVDYLKTRSQFGVPIGKFQALQHRMVDCCLEIEQARSLVMLAANEFQTPGDALDRVLAAMKVKVGQSGRLMAEEGIQMHGGIGMTWEYSLGHFAKRLIMIDHQLGDVDYHMKRFMALKAAA